MPNRATVAALRLLITKGNFMNNSAARLAGTVAIIVLALTASADAKGRRVSNYGGTFAYSWGPNYANFNHPVYAGCPIVGERLSYPTVMTATFFNETAVSPFGSWSYRAVARDVPNRWCLAK
jgi:hypothetical protein